MNKNSVTEMLKYLNMPICIETKNGVIFDNALQDAHDLQLDKVVTSLKKSNEGLLK